MNRFSLLLGLYIINNTVISIMLCLFSCYFNGYKIFSKWEFNGINIVFYNAYRNKMECWYRF